MSENGFNRRLHLFQVGEGGFHLFIQHDAERVDGEVLEVFHRVGVVEVAAEEHAVTVLDF